MLLHQRISLSNTDITSLEYPRYRQELRLKKLAYIFIYLNLFSNGMVGWSANLNNYERVFLLVGTKLKDLIRESLGLKDKHEKKETVASCDELEELIVETRMLLRRIQDVKSASARQTCTSLNKELLLLWEKFFIKCPKMAKKYLHQCTRLARIWEQRL